jgi:hypothetical protein
MRSLLVALTLTLAACGSDGACEIDDGLGGMLCYDPGGYGETECESALGTFSADAACSSLSSNSYTLCTDENAYDIFGDSDCTCYGFNDEVDDYAEWCGDDGGE